MDFWHKPHNKCVCPILLHFAGYLKSSKIKLQFDLSRQQKITFTAQEVQLESEEFFKDEPEAHKRHAVNALHLNYGSIWRVFRK